jgi:phenylalanyl-tRNA synthetase alpha subunit
VGELPKEERPAFGQRANEIKRELEAAYEKQAQALKAAEMEKALAEGGIDVTLPGRPVTTRTLRERPLIAFFDYTDICENFYPHYGADQLLNP